MVERKYKYRKDATIGFFQPILLCGNTVGNMRYAWADYEETID